MRGKVARVRGSDNAAMPPRDTVPAEGGREEACNRTDENVLPLAAGPPHVAERLPCGFDPDNGQVMVAANRM